DVGKTIQQALVDNGTKLREVIKDLAAGLHPVSDDLGRSLDQIELQVRVWLHCAFSNAGGGIGEAGFTDVLKRVAIHAALREKVAHGKPTLRKLQNARKARNSNACP